MFWNSHFFKLIRRWSGEFHHQVTSTSTRTTTRSTQTETSKTTTSMTQTSITTTSRTFTTTPLYPPAPFSCTSSLAPVIEKMIHKDHLNVFLMFPFESFGWLPCEVRHIIIHFDMECTITERILEATPTGITWTTWNDDPTDCKDPTVALRVLNLSDISSYRMYICKEKPPLSPARQWRAEIQKNTTPSFLLTCPLCRVDPTQKDMRVEVSKQNLDSWPPV